jgi:putative transcriptional regulator
MIQSAYLNNQFLVAMPTLKDTNFSHTVSYLCQHNDQGALAIVINRPTGMTLGDILDQMQIKTSFESVRQIPIYAGGPVQIERGFIIHTTDKTDWDSSIMISDMTCLTSSRDILEAIAQQKGPEKFLIALGYAGWGEGQLEKEIISNAWLNTPYQEHILFETSANQRWNEAASQLGIDINLLTTPAGHG